MAQFVPVCQSCDRRFKPNVFQPFCPCGGMVDMRYDLDEARVRDNPNPLLRFMDLLPIAEESHARWLGEGNTPTIHARALGRSLGLDKLYLKDETKNPTRSTKDRMAAVALSYFKGTGVREFACSSTGNSSSAYAFGVTRFGDCRLHVFVGRDFLQRMNFDSSERVKVYWVKDATFAEAHECAKVFAQRNKQSVTGEGGFFNPGRREGLKLAFMEGALDMPESPHWYLQAASSGMGVYGTWRGAQQLYRLRLISRLPRLVCVQQDGCDPMVRAWSAGSPVIRPQDVVAEPTGIAEAILRGDPTRTYPHLRGVVSTSGGTFLSVSQAEIREAETMIRELEGIEACFSSATTIAAARRMAAAGEMRRDDVVFVNLTGGNRDRAITPREYVTMEKAELLESVEAAAGDTLERRPRRPVADPAA
jgi:threonine synthase